MDVVAIHGIIENVFNTWIDPNEKLWLRDFLPNDFFEIRVFSFDYAAEIIWSLNIENLNAYSKSLLKILKKQRKKNEISHFS